MVLPTQSLDWRPNNIVYDEGLLKTVCKWKLIIVSRICSFNWCLLNSYYVQGTCEGLGIKWKYNCLSIRGMKKLSVKLFKYNCAKWFGEFEVM